MRVLRWIGLGCFVLVGSFCVSCWTDPFPGWDEGELKRILGEKCPEFHDFDTLLPGNAVSYCRWDTRCDPPSGIMLHACVADRYKISLYLACTPTRLRSLVVDAPPTFLVQDRLCGPFDQRSYWDLHDPAHRVPAGAIEFDAAAWHRLISSGWDWSSLGLRGCDSHPTTKGLK